MSAHRTALALSIAATTVTLLAAAPPASAKVTCATKGSTLAAGPSARVFVATAGGRRRVYGCATSVNRLRTLGPAGGEGGIDTSVVALTGVRVAFVLTSCSETGCQRSVLVRNLKTAKPVSAALAAPGDVDQAVTDLVLAATGTVAWIAEERAGGGAATQRYVSARKPNIFTGIAVVPLAAGLNIAAGSLALAGTTLYWTQAGPRAASIA